MSDILLVTAHYEGPGGIQTLSRDLVDLLERNGHSVQLLTFDTDSRYWSVGDILPNPAYLNSSADLTKIRWLLRNAVVRRTENVCRSRSDPPDAVHIMHISCWPALSIVKEYFPDAARVLSIHHQELEQQAVVQKAIHEATIIHTVSKATKKTLTESFTNTTPIRVSYPILDPAEYRTATENIKTEVNPRICLTLSRLSLVKNIDTLIQAWKQVNWAEVDESWKLLIAGDGPDRKYLEDLSKECDDIELVGRVSNKEKMRLYAQSSLFALLSTTRGPNGFDREGFGIVFAEAQAAGLPCLTSDEGGVVEAVGNGGIIVKDERNPVAVEKDLFSLLTDPDLRSELSSHARKRADRLSPDNQIQEYEPLYE